MGIYESVNKLLESGPASSNRYEAIFTGGGIGGSPGWISGDYSTLRQLNEHSRFLIQSIQFPGRSFTTGELRGEMGIGLTRKYVTSVMFNEFAMTFLLTGDMAVHDIFNNWYEKTGVRRGRGPTNRQDIRMNWYDSYIDPKIILKKFERTGESSMTCLVYNAFPINLSDLSLTSSSNNNQLEFTVNFAYETFENVYGGQAGEQVAGLGGLFGGKSANDSDFLRRARKPFSAFSTGATLTNLVTGWTDGLGSKKASDLANSTAAETEGNGDGSSGSEKIVVTSSQGDGVGEEYDPVKHG